MKLSIKTLVAVLVLFGAMAAGYFLFFSSDEFSAQANPAPACQSAVFDKSAMVFDHVLICGTKGVPIEKLTHAAHVTAEWLDNDGDGLVDEPRLLEAFAQNKPTLIMSAEGISLTAMPRIMTSLGDARVQDLYASETNPADGARDAAQEEIHHLIMNASWQTIFPEVFSEAADDNSQLYQAWQLADQNRQYVYNDPTCDDSCKVTEFVYLATAAYMETGAELDLASDEMRLKTQAELFEAIPAMEQIFESANYSYPTNHWPTGNYPFPENIEYFGVQ